MNYIDEISKYYSEWWENPSDIRNVVFESLNELVRSRIPKGQGKRALDVGSGRGRIVSYLLGKGYEVTAVDFNRDFAVGLKEKFPEIRVIQEDICHLNLDHKFDLCTMIEVAQNLRKKDLIRVLRKLAKITRLLFINMSNRNSLHGRWIELRNFRNKFVFPYTPDEFESILKDAGFDIIYRKGVGLVTPVSLFEGFRGKLIPVSLAKTINDRLDKYATKLCHLYYVEAITKSQGAKT